MPKMVNYILLPKFLLQFQFHEAVLSSCPKLLCSDAIGKYVAFQPLLDSLICVGGEQFYRYETGGVQTPGQFV